MRNCINAGILGKGLKHTFSPVLHKKIAAMAGIDLNYLVFDTEESRLEDAVRGLRALGFTGCNVTIPFKEKVMKYVDCLSREADIIGAVNTLIFSRDSTRGENTDWSGFTDDWRALGMGDTEGASAVILGAGGAAGAVLFALIEMGIKEAYLFSRNQNRAEGLSQRFEDAFPGLKLSCSSFEDEKVLGEALRRADILINATPAGMYPHEDSCPIPRGLMNDINTRVRVYDLIYNPVKTRLMSAAESLGCKKVSGGLGMLVRQGAASFEMWTGIKPDIDRLNLWAREALQTQFSGGR